MRGASDTLCELLAADGNSDFYRPHRFLLFPDFTQSRELSGIL
jgi:hypothetical protein